MAADDLALIEDTLALASTPGINQALARADAESLAGTLVDSNQIKSMLAGRAAESKQ